MRSELPAGDLPGGDAVMPAWEVLSTLLPRSPLLPFAHDPSVLLKAESLMPTGSFKIRGATYRMALLTPAQRARGVVAYSTGNHAQAVARAARDAGVAATIVMSPDAPPDKVDATHRLGAAIVMAASTSQARRDTAEALARERGATLIPPYEDPVVIAGQGTIAVELVQQVRTGSLAAVYVPVGGGGLLAGMALALKRLSPRTRVIGVEPELEDDACRSFASGQLQGMAGPSPSMADAIRVQCLGRLNFELIRRHVDDMVTVSEGAIAQTVHDCFAGNRLVVEPAGAVALAAARHHRQDNPHASAPVVAIVSGGNTTAAWLQQLIQGRTS
ncbi:MAG: pyridoxal-phosphate dependent enzyme [Proteobacteria bacterium]|jgi:threonine dehydratase|nr:pyridoxal-phosphate dependent enzyme [Ramlibacter sp.]MCA0214851.1 pyridoxal-phosphate dependent enzyme [Pseudomonadota bacterium]